MILLGFLSAAGLLILMFKFGIRRIIAFDIPVDIAITSFLMAMFAGTYGGMGAAMIGGLVVSVVLFILRKTMYREEPTIVKTNSFPYRKAIWLEVPPWSRQHLSKRKQ